MTRLHVTNEIDIDVRESTTDWRRILLAVLTLCLLIAGGALWFSGDDKLWHMLMRPALAFGCLWLAWPMVRRPVHWLPPGVAAAVLLGIGAVAARPRLLVVVLPMAGVLGALAAVIRVVRGPRR